MCGPTRRHRRAHHLARSVDGAGLARLAAERAEVRDGVHLRGEGPNHDERQEQEKEGAQDEAKQGAGFHKYG